MSQGAANHRAGREPLPAQGVELSPPLQQPQSGTVQPPEQVAADEPLPEDFDMRDSQSDKGRWPALAQALELCEQTILPVYDEADRIAMSQQRWHKRVATATAICGTIAVLCAIVDLGAFFSGHWLVTVEAICAGLALIAVLLGLLLRFHKKWLIQRNKAERCRFLKYRFLIEYTLASGDEAARQARTEELHAAAAELRHLNNEAQFEHWARTDPLMELLSMHEQGPKAEDVLP